MIDIDNIRLRVQGFEAAGVNAVVCPFLTLMLVNGLRVSDMLKIRRSDIIAGGRVYIRQGKGSTPLMVLLTYDIQFWELYRCGSYTDISCFNYMYFYRLCDKLGLALYNGVGCNRSVTHSGRKELARTVFNQTGSLEAAQTALGHKSSRSTQYYLTDAQNGSIMKSGILDGLKTGNSMFKVKNRFGSTFLYMKK